MPAAPPPPVPDATPAELENLRNALGGAANILTAEPAAKTRLLVTVRGKNLVKPGLAEAAGLDLLVPGRGDEVRVLVGLRPERYRSLL